MKKLTKKLLVRWLAYILILGISVILLCCLGELPFEPGEIGVNITGEISTTDITSAVLMINNKSKTVDVTSFTITQPEWQAQAGSENMQAPSITIDNKPKRLEKKAQYVAPSDKSYNVVFKYDFDALNGKPAGSGTKTLSIPLPLPRQIVEIFIYRNSNGDVIFDKEINNSDPNDLGDPSPENSLGEGSSPAVIPPEYRNRMATFVTINMTKSQIIGSVSFHKGTSNYTTGNIGTMDRQSIALGQGGWETRVTYTKDNVTKTLGPVNSIIVPSNDPQSVKEHYLYFYLNNRREYAISQTWPPFPNDVNEEDMLPVDNGFGRGLIKIINNSSNLVVLATIRNMQDTAKFPLTFDYVEFSPPAPIQYSQTGYVDVVGTSSFPIDAHGNYLIQVTLEDNNSNTSIVERRAYIKDQVVTVVIEGNDLNPNSARGALITIENKTSSCPVEITGLMIRNKANNWQSSYYGKPTWTPNTFIGIGNKATQTVISSIAMPIIPRAEFEAIAILHANGNYALSKTVKIWDKTGTTEEAILYSEAPLAQNLRTIKITDFDVPDELKPTTPPPTKPDIAGPGIGEIIEIDGIEWIKVRTQGDLALLMLKDVTGQCVPYDKNGRILEYIASPSIKAYVDTWYASLNAPFLKSIAYKANFGTTPSASWPGAKAAASDFISIAFVPRLSDITTSKPIKANGKRYWLSDINQNKTTLCWYGSIIKENGDFVTNGVLTNLSTVFVRPCIWVTMK